MKYYLMFDSGIWEEKYNKGRDLRRKYEKERE